MCELGFRLSDIAFAIFAIVKFREFARSRSRKTIVEAKKFFRTRDRIVVRFVDWQARWQAVAWPVRPECLSQRDKYRYVASYTPLKKVRQYSSSLDVSTAWPVGCI